MPILAGLAAAPPRAPATSRRDPFTVAWIDPDGVQWDWSDRASGCVALSVTGIGSPPSSSSGSSLDNGGYLPLAYGAAQRSIVVGLVAFNDSSHAAFMDLIDRIARALWCERAGQPTPGTLVISRPDGTSRQIELLCTSGPEHSDEDGTRNAYRWNTSYALTLVSALDPLFSDATATKVTFEAAPAGGGVPPMPPVLLEPGAVLGSTSVINQGNGDAYPIWRITGPGTPTLTNITTGRSFGLDVDLSSGETVTVDTRPARQSAVDQDDNDRWNDLVKVSPRDLWVLPSGKSDLNMVIASAGVGSKIEMSYVRRWLRA